MGIFYDHGIAYLIFKNNSEYITVISSKECDDKLEKSNYFKKIKIDGLKQKN